MDAVTIRAATFDDAFAIAAVHTRTWQVAYRGQVPDDYLDSLNVESRGVDWQHRLEAQTLPRHTFVAEMAGQIVAFAAVGKSRDTDALDTTGELYAIYVAPDAMNQGIGAALMAAGEEHLIAHGFTHATLWVLESNQRARRFYESKGWAADGVRRVEAISGVTIPEMRYAITFKSQ